MSSKNDMPNKQRALLLQGGGALGAYESGVLSVLCKELTYQFSEGLLIQATPDFKIEAKAWVTSDRFFASEWVLTATQKEDLPGIPASFQHQENTSL